MVTTKCVRKWWIKPMLLIAGLAAQPGLANAQDCETFGTQIFTNSFSQSITLNTGDTVSVSAVGDFFVVDVFSSAPDFFYDFIYDIRPSTSYTSTADGVQVTVFSFILNQSDVTVSCSPVSVITSDLIAEAASISAVSQGRAISNGLAANTRSRFGSGTNMATRDGFFVSTQNIGRSALETPEFNFWISGELRSFSGGLDGFSTDIVLGADRFFSENLLAGVLLAYGRTDLDDGTSMATVDSPALGAYLAGRFSGGLVLDGYVAYARPKTETAGTSFTADRVTASLMLSGSYSVPQGMFRPFARIIGYAEDQPAYTGSGGAVAANEIENYTASMGARFESADPLGTTLLLPYVSGAMDYGYSSTSLGRSDNYLYPRIGVGLAGPMGAGYLSLDLDAGKVRSNTYDIGFQMTYEMTF